VGLFARKALDRSAAQVVAVEPAPENLACLRRNLAPEIAAGRVLVCPKGVWDRPDTLALHVQPTNSAANSFVRGQASPSDVRVPLVPVDRLVSELKLERVDFIKMDVEGAERRALAGARATLARFRPRLAIASYHLKDDPRAIADLVAALRPDYRKSCGACFEAGGRVNAEVLWFR
jgi:FkbM family methyltransferase